MEEEKLETLYEAGEEGEEKLESNISKIVSESITKILIVIIMGMIFIIPLLDWSFWLDESAQNYNTIANTIESLLTDGIGISPQLNTTILNYIQNSHDDAFPIINVTYGNITFYINETVMDYNYRLEEVSAIVSTGSLVTVNFDVIQQRNILAIISLAKTLFICGVLIISSFMFEGDANELVLRPLDVMTNIIQKVVNDPIGARNLDAMNIIQEVEKQKKIEEEKEANVLHLVTEIKEDKEESAKEKKMEEILEEHAEIQVIQKSIIKISALLAIGFGEAGSDIIKSNLKSHKDLDPMMKGAKKTVFMGFCDIRGFLLVNEALKQDSVIFVNRIAEIVHKSVDKFGGATNKNIGDAFLNVWKFPEFSPKNEVYEICPTNIYSQIVADKAVLSFLYVIRAIKLNRDILDYSEDDRINNLFPDHGYKVNMGFGLHYGWAIEGTVGSKFKIDASYLSPNVNIAARLEAATRQYGVTILISGTVYEFLSNTLKSICREIDRVTVKGSINAIRLFTIDVNIDYPENEELIKKKKEHLNPNEKIKKFLEKKILYKNYFDKCDSTFALNVRSQFFLHNLRPIFEHKMPDNFYEKFRYGFEKYISGKWPEAVKYFKKCLLINPNDKPTHVLLDYMNEFNSIAPANWKGYRELTSK